MTGQYLVISKPAKSYVTKIKKAKMFSEAGIQNNSQNRNIRVTVFYFLY